MKTFLNLFRRRWDCSIGSFLPEGSVTLFGNRILLSLCILSILTGILMYADVVSYTDETFLPGALIFGGFGIMYGSLIHCDNLFIEFKMILADPRKKRWKKEWAAEQLLTWSRLDKETLELIMTNTETSTEVNDEAMDRYVTNGEKIYSKEKVIDRQT